MKKIIKKPQTLINIICIYAIIFCVSISRASKLEAKSSLKDGINQINYQTSLLRQSKAIKYEKLASDLEEFSQKGSSGIDSTNTLYLLNTGQFSEEELESAIENTGLEGLGKDFKAAEDKYGVNAILLMAMAKHETGNGTSELFKDKNNLFGFNAIDADPYNKASKFTTPADSINTVAKHLKENYLSPDGQYYNGVSTDGIGISYATDPDWARKVNWMMIEVSQNMIDSFEKEAGN